MTYNLVLTYACGCTDTFGPVVLDPGDDARTTCSAPCVPESCQSCLRAGRPCPTRAGMVNYTPVIWSEMQGRPSRKTRIANTGTRAWETPIEGDTPQHDRQHRLPS